MLYMSQSQRLKLILYCPITHALYWFVLVMQATGLRDALLQIMLAGISSKDTLIHRYSMGQQITMLVLVPLLQKKS